MGKSMTSIWKEKLRWYLSVSTSIYTHYSTDSKWKEHCEAFLQDSLWNLWCCSETSGISFFQSQCLDMATPLDLPLPKQRVPPAWTRFELVAISKNGMMKGRNLSFNKIIVFGSTFKSICCICLEFFKLWMNSLSHQSVTLFLEKFVT